MYISVLKLSNNEVANQLGGNTNSSFSSSSYIINQLCCRSCAVGVVLSELCCRSCAVGIVLSELMSRGALDLKRILGNWACFISSDTQQEAC